MKTKKRSKKQQRESKVFSIILLCTVFIITGLLIFSNWKIGQKKKTLFFKIQSLKQEIEFLENRNEELRNGIFQSQTNDYWEEKVREQGYKKPGETAIVIKKDTNEGITSDSTDSKNIWNKLLTGIKEIF